MLFSMSETVKLSCCFFLVSLLPWQFRPWRPPPTVRCRPSLPAPSTVPFRVLSVLLCLLAVGLTLPAPPPWTFQEHKDLLLVLLPLFPHGVAQH